MVLLTSSTVSGIIFAAVVSLFTFLLFLSGYILQQQTVRSLQESLRRPPEPKPVPTLPPGFAKQPDEDTDADISHVLESTLDGGFDSDSRPIQEEEDDTVVVISSISDDGTPGSSVDDLESESTTTQAQEQTRQTRQSLAYILSVPDPLDICSVLLFAQKQRQQSRLQTKPTIMVLYPTTWESSGASAHISALTLMRDLQEELALTYHPVTITSGRSRASLTSQLLGELQRLRWDYDRALYLRSPGLAVDIDSIDQALARSSIKKSWSRLAASAGHDPGMLLYAKAKGGLLMARGDMRRLIGVSDSNSQELDEQRSDEDAAYVLFDNEELEHYEDEDGDGDGDGDDDGLDFRATIIERFIKERKGICGGRGLLPGEADKVDLRRKKAR